MQFEPTAKEKKEVVYYVTIYMTPRQQVLPPVRQFGDFILTPRQQVLPPVRQFGHFILTPRQQVLPPVRQFGDFILTPRQQVLPPVRQFGHFILIFLELAELSAASQDCIQSHMVSYCSALKVETQFLDKK